MIKERDREIINLIRFSGRFLFDSTGGKSAQKIVLMKLHRYGNMSQKDLQNHMKIKSSSLSEIIKRMENNGILVKERDKDDQRVVLLSLTEKGKKIAYSNHKHMDLTCMQLLECLDEYQRDELYDLLNILYKHWSLLKESGTLLTHGKEINDD